MTTVCTNPSEIVILINTPKNEAEFWHDLDERCTGDRFDPFVIFNQIKGTFHFTHDLRGYEQVSIIG